MAAGSGVTGDLLAHCIDTALWLNGAIRKVNAMTETFVTVWSIFASRQLRVSSDSHSEPTKCQQPGGGP